MMATGRIVSLREHGFGFITRDDGAPGRDLFFHRSGVVADGFDALRVGQRAPFDAEPDPREPTRRAVPVAPLADEPQP